MASSGYRNKNLRRPVKRGSAKRSKVLAQSRRLVTLGVPQEKVDTMTYREVRDVLRFPAKIVVG